MLCIPGCGRDTPEPGDECGYCAFCGRDFEGMKSAKVSRKPGGTVARKSAGATGEVRPPALSEPRRGAQGPHKPLRSFSKGPTSEQFTVMAGSMFNALEQLRSVSDFVKRHSDSNCGWLQPGAAMEVHGRLGKVENMLRVGLKARFRK
jgi:hypothetical protein